MAEQTGEKTRHTAGAFDIRTFIAALMGIYGVILLLTAFFGAHKTTDGSTASGSINLLVSIGLLIFAGLMQGWAVLRPTVVDEEQLEKDRAEQDGQPPAH